MLAAVPPSTAVSSAIVTSVPSLISKETHDAATSILATALPSHISSLLRADSPLSADITALLASGMTHAKPVIRRAFCAVVGDVFWELEDLKTDAEGKFARAVFPSFEVNLRTVVANPLGAVAGPLEGYIAMAVLLGPILRSGKFGTF